MMFKNCDFNRDNVVLLKQALTSIDPRRFAIVEKLLLSLIEHKTVVGVFLHGSITQGKIDEFSDLDLIIVVKDGHLAEIEQLIDEFCDETDNLLFIGRTDRYSWFGHLNALYWRKPLIFSIDIGSIEESTLDRFHIQSSAIVLKDTNKRIIDRKADSILENQLREDVMVMDSEYEVFNLLFKIRKSLHRGHLWNAFEYVSQLRRVYIRFLREDLVSPYHASLGRPDRDIEDFVSELTLEMLKNTIPSYERASLRDVAVFLARRILELPKVTASWVRRDAIFDLLEVLEREFPIKETRVGYVTNGL